MKYVPLITITFLTLFIQYAPSYAQAKAAVQITILSHSNHVDENPSEDAIQALSIIMDSTKFENMMKMPKSERIKAYQNFWKEKDPTPDTDKNELQKEFLTRLDEANQHFNNLEQGKKGWQTDRGRILIQYGHPDTIVNPRNEGSHNSHYEIWNYKYLKKRFVFRYDKNSHFYQLISEN